MVGTNVGKLFSILSPKMTLIDGDEGFYQRVASAASRMNVKMETRSNIVDIYRNPPRDSDIFILAYDLGRVNGIQLSQYLENNVHASFVILVIQGGLDQLKIRLPSCVKAVISKDLGGEEILSLTRRLFKCYRSPEI